MKPLCLRLPPPTRHHHVSSMWVSSSSSTMARSFGSTCTTGTTSTTIHSPPRPGAATMMMRRRSLAPGSCTTTTSWTIRSRSFSSSNSGNFDFLSQAMGSPSNGNNNNNSPLGSMPISNRRRSNNSQPNHRNTRNNFVPHESGNGPPPSNTNSRGGGGGNPRRRPVYPPTPIPVRHSRTSLPPACPDAVPHLLQQVQALVQTPVGHLFAYTTRAAQNQEPIESTIQLQTKQQRLHNQEVQEREQATTVLWATKEEWKRIEHVLLRDQDQAWQAANATIQHVEYLMRGLARQVPGTLTWKHEQRHAVGMTEHAVDPKQPHHHPSSSQQPDDQHQRRHQHQDLYSHTAAAGMRARDGDTNDDTNDDSDGAAPPNEPDDDDTNDTGDWMEDDMALLTRMGQLQTLPVPFTWSNTECVHILYAMQQLIDRLWKEGQAYMQVRATRLLELQSKLQLLPEGDDWTNDDDLSSLTTADAATALDHLLPEGAGSYEPGDPAAASPPPGGDESPPGYHQQINTVLQDELKNSSSGETPSGDDKDTPKPPPSPWDQDEAENKILQDYRESVESLPNESDSKQWQEFVDQFASPGPTTDMYTILLDAMAVIAQHANTTANTGDKERPTHVYTTQHYIRYQTPSPPSPANPTTTSANLQPPPQPGEAQQQQQQQPKHIHDQPDATHLDLWWDYLTPKTVNYIWGQVFVRNELDGGGLMNQNVWTVPNQVCYNAPVRTMAALPFDHSVIPRTSQEEQELGQTLANSQALIQDHGSDDKETNTATIDPLRRIMLSKYRRDEALYVGLTIWNQLSQCTHLHQSPATYAHVIDLLSKYLPDASDIKGHTTMWFFRVAQHEGVVDPMVVQAFLQAQVPSNVPQIDAWIQQQEPLKRIWKLLYENAEPTSNKTMKKTAKKTYNFVRLPKFYIPYNWKRHVRARRYHAKDDEY